MYRLTTVTRNLIIANVIVFVLQIALESQFGLGFPEYYGALWPWQSGNLKGWQLVTHMFMHGNFSHLFFNMLSLFFFGPKLEATWGAKRFFTNYIICGLAAGVAELLLATSIHHSLGASGAIMGVMVAYAYLYPNDEIYLYFVPVPVKWAVVAFVAIDLFSGVSGKSDGIAHFAHLGGALAGFLLAYTGRHSTRRRY